MTSVQGHGRPRRKCPSVALSVTLSIAHFDSSPPPELGDELSNQLTGPSGGTLLANSPPAANNIPKYSEDDL